MLSIHPTSGAGKFGEENKFRRRQGESGHEATSQRKSIAAEAFKALEGIMRD